MTTVAVYAEACVSSYRFGPQLFDNACEERSCAIADMLFYYYVAAFKSTKFTIVRLVAWSFTLTAQVPILRLGHSDVSFRYV